MKETQKAPLCCWAEIYQLQRCEIETLRVQHPASSPYKCWVLVRCCDHHPQYRAHHTRARLCYHQHRRIAVSISLKKKVFWDPTQPVVFQLSPLILYWKMINCPLAIPFKRVFTSEYNINSLFAAKYWTPIIWWEFNNWWCFHNFVDDNVKTVIPFNILDQSLLSTSCHLILLHSGQHPQASS